VNRPDQLLLQFLGVISEKIPEASAVVSPEIRGAGSSDGVSRPARVSVAVEVDRVDYAKPSINYMTVRQLVRREETDAASGPG
jgi:hypothetical protein